MNALEVQAVPYDDDLPGTDVSYQIPPQLGAHADNAIGGKPGHTPVNVPDHEPFPETWPLERLHPAMHRPNYKWHAATPRQQRAQQVLLVPMGMQDLDVS